MCKPYRWCLVAACSLCLPLAAQPRLIAQVGAQDSFAEPDATLKKASYLIGRNLIDDFRAQEVEIDVEQLIRGIRAAAQGEKSPLSADEARAALAEFNRIADERLQARMKLEADKNMRAGEAFLRENALRPGVIQLENGVQYQVLQAGSGPKPRLNDKVQLHFHGRNLAGQVFDSTRELKEPVALPVASISVSGLIDTVLRMPVGSKWEVAIPPAAAYGVEGLPPEIGPNETLIFEVELIGIEPSK